ncbi:ABC transporter permease [Nocardioides sp. C4-1]|uniref:ABC transporter permease n=1 Tax=Nocardioides sp. C4-1 TaxID=3151851 RepID=UPI003263C7FF
MFRLALSSVRHSLGRYLATLVAIIAGVGFFTAVSVVSDGVIDSLEGNVDDQYGNVDVAVVADDGGSATNDVAANPLKVPQATVDELLDLDGVEAGAGVLTSPVAFAGDDGKPFATGTTGRLWVEDDELNPIDVTEGEAPLAPGQVAVDRGLADDEDLAVGDELPLLTLAGPQDVTIVGITEFGDSDAVDPGGTISISPDDAFDWLSSGTRQYDSYYLRVSGSPDDVVSAGSDVVPAGFDVQSGDEFRDDQRAATGGFANNLKIGLQGFAVLALLVGGFVIYNTFSVIVAQRLRELAVLAAIGATPKQLKRSLRAEGLVLGVLGSLLGVAAGYGLTLLLEAILQATGNSLPGGLSFSATNIVSGVLLGTIITLLSVMSPARKAGRTEPMEAMREAAVEPPRPRKVRALLAVVLLGLGLAGMLTSGSLAVVGASAVAVIASVFVGAPYLALIGAAVVRPLLQRRGIEGRLAVDNSVRNPRRTATTANALLVGVFLVTFVAVAGASLRDYVVDEVNDLQSADFMISTTGGVVDDDLVSQLDDVDGVEQVVAFQRQPVVIDGAASTASSGDLAALREVSGFDIDEGSLDDLAPGTIAVLDDGEGTPSVGDTVPVGSAEGETVDLEVVAVLVQGQDTLQTGALIAPETFTEIVGDAPPTIAFLALQDDVGDSRKDDIEDGIEAITDQRPDLTAMSGNLLGELIGTIMDFLIQAVTGLLLMSVVIALIGIVNTMSLSILERRRELGLLRIIGMTDKRVRRMVRLESVLISMLGTVSGLVLGLAVSLLMVISINLHSDLSLTPSVPVVQLVTILVVGVVLGVLAALLPARRSTRMEVLDAVSAG